MKKTKESKTTDNKFYEIIIGIVFWVIVFCCILLFYTKYHPLTIFDTDDWTYLRFTRYKSLLPGINEWNPIKVLPETLMPLAAYFGVLFIYPARGDYILSVMLGLSIVFSVILTLYFWILMKMLQKKYNLPFYQRILLSLFIIFFHYMAFVNNKSVNASFFIAGNSTCMYNYVCAALVNCITVCYLEYFKSDITYQEKKRKPLITVVAICLIYFSVFSNLFDSIILVSYVSAVIVIGFCFDTETKFQVKKCIIQFRIHFITILLWAVSLLFEMNGGRAKQVGKSKLDIVNTMTLVLQSITKLNIFFGAVILLSIVFSIILVCYYAYLKKNKADINKNLENIKKQGNTKSPPRLSYSLQSVLYLYIIIWGLYLFYHSISIEN